MCRLWGWICVLCVFLLTFCLLYDAVARGRTCKHKKSALAWLFTLRNASDGPGSVLAFYNWKKHNFQLFSVAKAEPLSRGENVVILGALSLALGRFLCLRA
jgi:hypothetical protein